MCNGPQHRAVASAAWPLLATTAGLPAWQVALGVIPAIAFSAGPTSPDWDNLGTRRFITRWIPGRWDDRLFAHRETTHSWVWPALVSLAPWKLDLGPLEFLLWSAITGWLVAHIAADAVFGRGGHSIRKGVPMFLWGNPRISVGFKSDGPASVVLVPLICGACWWWTLGHPDPVAAVAWLASR
jgi:membrane-bound metal-dependent hydrolase YbcI (DUF457 family)